MSYPVKKLLAERGDRTLKFVLAALPGLPQQAGVGLFGVRPGASLLVNRGADRALVLPSISLGL